MNFGGNHLDESAVASGMDISGAAMDISTGLYSSQRIPTPDEQELQEQAMREELERTWGLFLKKVQLSPSVGFTGSTQPFSLPDVAAVLGLCMPNSLNDSEQQEELAVFQLGDHRIAAVWVAHCDSLKCCGSCINSVAGIVGPSPQDVVQSLPPNLRRYITKF